MIFVKALAPGDVRFKAELSAKELTAGPIVEEESTTIYTDIRSRLQKGQEYMRETKRLRRR